MKQFFLAVVLLGFLCSCAHNPEPPLYSSNFHTEKDAFIPNGWLNRVDGFFAKPESFEVNPIADKYDENANTFTVTTGASPTAYYYCGYYDVNDDSIVDVVSDAAGRGSFSLGVEFYDADRNLIGERHQGFNIITEDNKEVFKNYRYRLYFLANENGKARYVRLMFIVDPSTRLTLRNISLDITPYTIDQQDSTYLKFKEMEEKEGYRKK
jgi:hypothetical protein